MNVLVRMPNWIGDAVMATPALNNLLRHFNGAEFVLVGSPFVAEMFREDPQFRAVATDASKLRKFHLVNVWNLGRQLRSRHGPFDLAWSFVNSLSSRVLLRASGASRRVAKKHAWHDFSLTHAIPVGADLHDAERQTVVVNSYLGTDYETGPTSLYVRESHRYGRPTAGINPGAAYGDAKRWPHERFAETALAIASYFDVVLFGGPKDLDVVNEIETVLRGKGVQNLRNAAGCSIAELLSLMADLDLFITNDTGPMHIAGAFGIPTVAVFGATNPDHTRPWANPKARIVRHELPCAPCGKRTCPLKHHECMRRIESREVIDAALSLIERRTVARAG
jgi:heptosyltransferase-2